MKYLIIVLVLLSISGCRSSYDLVYKANQKDRPGTALACSELFHRTDSISTRVEYVKGDTVYFPGQTITLNCDSLVEANKAAGRSNNAARIHCPPSTHVTDTIKKSDFVMWQDLSRVIPLESKVSKLEQEVVQMQTVNKQKSGEIRRLWIVLVAFGGYFLFRIVCRIKFPIIYKFLL